MQRIEVTARDRQEIARVQSQIDGTPVSGTVLTCVNCGRRMRPGYLMTALKWKSTQYSRDFPVLKVAEALCRECAGSVRPSKRPQRVHGPIPGQEPSVSVATTAKEIARKLLTVMSDVPHGSRRLCQMAGIEYGDLIVPILKKLRAVGKVRFQEGRWTRA